MKILICVPAFNRKSVTELVLSNLGKYKGEGQVWAYNDRSTAYDNAFLEPLCDRVFQLPESGINFLRWTQLRQFAAQKEFDYLYLTDNDALHDPGFVGALSELYGKYSLTTGSRLPVCIYNTVFHSQPENLLGEGPDVFLRKSCPGISMFYDRGMVEKMVFELDKLGSDPKLPFFDYLCPQLLGLPYLHAKTSYVEHFGAGHDSMHTPAGQWDRDRAVNPTAYLKTLRAPIIAYLEGRAVIKPVV